MSNIALQAIDAADWSEVGVSSSQLSSGQWYGRASLEQLRPSSQYMVQVSSLNQEGYSKFSPVTFFTTPIEGNSHPFYHNGAPSLQSLLLQKISRKRQFLIKKWAPPLDRPQPVYWQPCWWSQSAPLSTDYVALNLALCYLELTNTQHSYSWNTSETCNTIIFLVSFLLFDLIIF